MENEIYNKEEVIRNIFIDTSKLQNFLPNANHTQLYQERAMEVWRTGMFVWFLSKYTVFHFIMVHS
jgi:hypothetical protein